MTLDLPLPRYMSKITSKVVDSGPGDDLGPVALGLSVQDHV